MSRKTKKPLGGGCSLARALATAALAASVASGLVLGSTAVLGAGTIALAPQQAWADDVGFTITGNEGYYSYKNGVLTVQDGANLTISASGLTSHRIVVAENAEATITLTGIDITAPTENPQPAIDLASGATLTLILADGSANTLTGGAGGTENGVSGIHVPTGTTLIIQGGGSLSVNGGSSETGYGGSGIGGNPAGTPLEAAEGCGTVVILATGSIQITGGNGSSTADGHDIGGGKGSPDDGDDGQGIKPVPGQVNTYEVWGELTLPEGVTIPEGAILTGSGSLNPKLPQAAPTGSFLTINHTDSSIMLNFSDSSQPVNENEIEVVCAAGMDPDAPTDGWIAAERIETSRVHVATIKNLSPGTPYTLFARYKGDDFHDPSPAFASESVYYTDPKITTESLPNAYVGVEYSAKLEAQTADGIAVRWSIKNGSLPGGLTLREDGAITGTPTAATPQALNITVCATFGKGAETKENTKALTVSVTKSDAELGDLTVNGNTGIPEGAFQYGDTITVAFTPQRKAVPSAQALAKTSAAANASAPGTATLTYTPDGGKPVTLAAASAQADGSFTLTYDTKQKTLPIMSNIPLTVSYGGSDALNPVTETVFVTLQKGMLRNRPSISGSYAYGETLTVNYTPQDDEKLSYQWFRSDSTSYAEIDGATSAAYTLTSEDIGKHVYVQIMPADEWHTGLLRSSPQVVTKATQAAPSAPTAAGTTTCGVTLNTIPASANGVAAEYGISKDGGKTWMWQGGPEFTGLSADTTYQFAARYGETDLYAASDPSAPVNIATDRLDPGGDTPGGDTGDDTPGGNPGDDGSAEDPEPEDPTDPIAPDADTPDPGDPIDPSAPQKKPALPETADPSAVLGVIVMVGTTAITAGVALAKRRRA